MLCDGRTAVARRFRDIYEQIVADLGGAEALSEGQRQLARRAGMLASICEGMEALAVQNLDDFDCDKFGVLVDRLGRLHSRLGLERRQRDVWHDARRATGCLPTKRGAHERGGHRAPTTAPREAHSYFWRICCTPQRSRQC